MARRLVLTEARRGARLRNGQLVPLDEQDRAGWDRALIADGHDLLRRLDRSAEAEEAHDSAIAAAQNSAERAYLSGKRGELARALGLCPSLTDR